MEELPYCVVGAIAQWLRGLKPESINNVMISRVRDFRDWCLAQPPGNDAGEDAMTIYTVAFFEDLFGYETTEKLIPHLMDLSDLERSKDYFTTWVGQKEYESALGRYGNRRLGKTTRKKRK